MLRISIKEVIIDAWKWSCHKCKFNELDVCNAFGVTLDEDDENPTDYLRCSECLEAEISK